MTFTQLEIFAVIAELGSFTAAGQRLGISQSAVSHALKQLETEWGVTLLSRGPTGIEITEIGRSLLLRVRELLGVSEAIQQEVAAVRGLNRGVLRIGSFGTTSSLHLLPHILEQFTQRYPEIDVRVDEGEDEEVSRWLIERRVDVGFVVLPDERFDTVPLVEDQFVALIPAAHPLAAKKAVSLADVSAMPFIMTLAGSASAIQRLFEQARLHPAVKQRYVQIITIIKMVENGSGFSIVADLAAPDQIMALCPGVTKKPLAPRVKRSVGLAVLKRERVSPAVKAFLTVARNVAATLR
ncbi:LysR family transcriptional regulator [Ralstonia solanacearum]|uniref:LysR family transcriptional regulator n=1 Tax=Ralstonia solanacearum TaxID=305 RepID=UPI0001817325|nr:LysR family transcriptional regulator [Ralstonia solanacearum]MDC6180590.1 LysR family transcriptional regulator [Ralstonia solanacearum]MDC6213231.1 LysR family transcriptional regulator [Ralstonia solanacearum]MDC6242185.1 LysR family transcriptional regulator [Ralstonia solanacearum]MDD7803824.1 LysR family transcriptional regulator [Ralstonia solanacearum]TYZ51671.1 LysR family transcriptional regulator [Ralstonia solanacearum]